MNRTSYIAIVVTTLFVMGIFFWVNISKADVPRYGNFQEITDIPLSKAKFTDEQGRAYTLEDFKGKLIILHSWASWCRPCLEELPEMIEFSNKNQDKNIVLIALHREPLREKVIIENFPIYFDEGNTLVQEMMMVKGIPSTLFIAPNGKVQGIVLGKASWGSAQMQERVDAMLKMAQ